MVAVRLVFRPYTHIYLTIDLHVRIAIFNDLQTMVPPGGSVCTSSVYMSSYTSKKCHSRVYILLLYIILLLIINIISQNWFQNTFNVVSKHVQRGFKTRSTWFQNTLNNIQHVQHDVFKTTRTCSMRFQKKAKTRSMRR